MSILINGGERVVVVGIRGRFGRRAVADLGAAGTEVVAGVTYGGQPAARDDLSVPVFGSVAQACTATQADAAIVYVPAWSAGGVLVETIEAGVRLLVYPGEGLPVADAIDVRACAKAHSTVVVGPNTPGVISPGSGKLGFMPSSCYTPGTVGVVSRSGSLSYEAAATLSRNGVGQSTAVGIGGDPVKGLSAAEALALFHDDVDTTAIVYLGEIGGSDEYAVAEYAERPDAKPVIAQIVGRTAPPGKQMGHAAALIGSQRDGWIAKAEALRSAGVHVAEDISDLAGIAREVVGTSTELTQQEVSA